MTRSLAMAKAHVLGIIPDAINRAQYDFYRTPKRAIEALLSVEKFNGLILEPACGDGAISEVLESHGHLVYSTDLIDRGYGESNHNFFNNYDRRIRGANLITNPPFSHVDQFARLSLTLVDRKVALLCRLLWLEGKHRHKDLFKHAPPARIWVFSSRVNVARNGDPRFLNGAGGMVAFAWYVWDADRRRQPPQIGWL